AGILLVPLAGRERPLGRQIYERIRESIESGRLAAKAPLPSTRALARDLRVARGTIIQAYEQLQSEGYIVARPGSATVVSESVPRRVEAPPASNASCGLTLSRRGSAIAAVPLRSSTDFGRMPGPFRSGVPALDVFPAELWGRLLSK